MPTNIVHNIWCLTPKEPPENCASCFKEEVAFRKRRWDALHSKQPPKFCPQVPTERQQLFLDQRKEKEVFYGGAAGGGKSSALLMAALEDVHVKNYSALLLRRTYADLAKPGALLDRAAGWLRNTSAKWNEQRKQWRFPSGAKLSFGYLETENDKYTYQSSEYQFIGFDELSQFSLSQYLYLFSRLRRLTNSSVPLRMRAGSNPGGVGGRWVQERFIPTGFTPEDAQETKAWVKTGRDEAGRDYRRIFVPARMHDNPHLDQVEYLESLNELDLVTREQLLKGDWQVRERGNILPMWTDDHAHVITWDEFASIFKTKHIPLNWLLGVYQDWGSTLEHPCVTSWFATAPASAPIVGGVSMAGAVFLYRGLTVSDKTVREVAGLVNEAMRPYGEKARVQKWQMSHEASSERIAYQREHALSFQSWPTGKTRGIAQLRNALELVETDKPHPFKSRVMGHPRLYHIIDDPAQLIYAVDDNGLSRHRSEIAAYRWATLKSGDPTVTVVPHALFNDAIDTERAAAADYWPLSARKTQAEIDEEKLRPELQMPAILNEINPVILQAKIQSRDLYLKRLDAENKKCQHKALAPARIRFRR